MADPSKAKQEWYVYFLVDPRDQSKFYVGKGIGKRAWQHEKEAISNTHVVNFLKTERIREILSLGMRVTVVFDSFWISEQDALIRENNLIAENPLLTNVSRSNFKSEFPKGNQEIRLLKLRARRYAIKAQCALRTPSKAFGAITGQQIRGGRKALNWTVAHLAHRAELSPSAIQKAESQDGMPNVHLRTVTAIKAALESGGVLFLEPGDSRTGGAGIRLRQ